MKIAFYSTKPYDKIWFESLNKEQYGFEIDFLESPCKEASIPSPEDMTRFVFL